MFDDDPSVGRSEAGTAAGIHQPKPFVECTIGLVGVAEQGHICLVFFCGKQISQQAGFHAVAMPVNCQYADSPEIRKGLFPAIRFKITVTFYGENGQHLKFPLDFFCIPHMIAQMNHMIGLFLCNHTQHWLGITMGIGKHKDIQWSHLFSSPA